MENNIANNISLPEEVQQRLATKQTLGQLSSIFKIVEKIQERLQEVKDPDQVPELEWLWSECTGGDVVISDACCQALLDLVLLGVLDASVVLGGLALRLQSAKSIENIVRVISDLLRLHVKKKTSEEEPYTCPFNLKAPLHPFISVLKQRPDAWYCLYKNVHHALFENPDLSESMLQLLRPFFLYCLCDPVCPDDLSGLRSLLWQMLTRLCQSNDLSSALALMLEVVAWMQVGGIQAEYFLHDLLRWMVSDLKADQTLLDSLCVCAAASCADVLTTSIIPMDTLQLLNKLVPRMKNGRECVYVYMVQFLKVCPKSCLQEALRLCSSLLTCEEVILYLQYCLFPVCLRITNIDSQFVREEKKMAAEILETLSKLEIPSQMEMKASSVNWITPELRHFHQSFSKVQELVNLAQEILQGEKGVIPALSWAETLRNRSDNVGVHEIVMLEGLFCCPGVDVKLSLRCLKSLIACAKLDVCRALDLFPLLLYKLDKEWDPELKLEILYEMTELTTHKLLVGPVLRVVQLLPSSPQLKPLAMRIMAKMYTHQPRAFPFLEKMLQQDSSGTAATKHQGMSEFMVAKAATIIEICKSNASLHGASLLAPLSQILNTCTGVDGAVPCAMALEGIMSLCEAEVIDIRTTWRVISPKLSKDRRPRVVIKFCEMMSLIGRRRVSNVDYEKLISEVLVLLWKLTSSSDPSISSAAFRSLASFKMESNTLAMLPQVAKEDLKIPEGLAATPLEAAKKPEELLKYIPGECFIKMLKHPADECLEAYGVFLASAVKQEVEKLPNSVYALAYQRAKAAGGVEPETYAYLDERSVLKPIIDYLRKLPKTGHPSPRHLGELVAILNGLAQELPRSLPSLNWDALLSSLLRLGSTVQLACLKIMLNQGIDHQGKGSVSAKKLLERCLSIDPLFALTVKQTDWVFDSLGVVGRVIPPQSLVPFVNAKLESSLNSPPRAMKLIRGLSKSLKDTRMHENNRVAVASIIETLIERIDPNQEELFNCYLDCLSDLPTKNLMRLTSPTLWWQVEDEKLRRAARLCAHFVTCDDNQLMWLNEVIDVASSNQCDKSGVLREIVRAVSSYHDSEKQKVWLIDLIGQIRRNARDLSKTQTTDATEKVTFLLDTLSLAILCWSRAVPLDRSLQWSREQRLQILPSCLAYLLTLPTWEDKAPQVLEWSIGVVGDRGLPPLYENCIKTSVRAMKTWPCYSSGTQWTKAISLHV